jgi:hypothetical protein
MPRINSSATPQERREFVFNELKSEMENIARVSLEVKDGKIEDRESSESYREPLEISLTKEIKILLSWGGPADGFKLTYRADELQGGVYYWQDWGTYDEAELTDEEAQAVEDFYLYGDPSTILNQNNE